MYRVASALVLLYAACAIIGVPCLNTAIRLAVRKAARRRQMSFS